MPAANDVVWIDILPSMRGFGPALEKGAASETESAGKSLGGRLSTGMKVAAAAGAAAIGAVLAKGIADNINIGKANDKLAAQLGLSAKESERVGKIAGSLYRDAYGDSIEGVNDAVGAVMSGIKGMSEASSKDLQSVTATALDFATAFEVDVQRAVQIAGQAVTTGLAKDATEAFDLITAGAQKVPSALREDFLDATDEYGQFFSALGYSGEQAMAMLVDASEDGMYGLDKMGDAIKEFTIRGTDMSKSTKDAFKDFGAGAEDIERLTNSLLEGGPTAQAATQEIVDGLLSIEDPGRQARAAIALFGTPLEDLNTTEIPAFLESMRGGSDAMAGFEGAAKEMGDTLNDNFATRMEGWKRTAQGFVQDALMKLADWGAKTVSWMGENKTLVIILTTALGALTTAALVYTGTVKVVTAATAAWNVIQKVLNGTIKANPIGLAVAALTLLAAAVVVAYKKSDTFREIVQAAWRGIQTAVRFAWERVIKPVLTAWKAYLDNFLIPAIRFLWQNVVRPVFDLIGGAIKAAWAVVKFVFGLWVDYMRNVLFPVIRFLWDNVVKPVFSGIGETIKWTWNNIIRPPLAALGSFIRDTVAPAFRRGVDAISTAWDRIKAAAARPVNFVIDTVYNNGIRAGFNKVAGFLGLDTRLPKMDPIGGSGRTMGSSARPARTGPGGMMAVGGAGSKIAGVLDKGWDWVKDQAFGGITGLLGKVGDSPWAQVVGGMGRKLLSSTMGFLSGKFASATDAGPSLPGGLVGKAGRVLPAGSYSIGMPYLGYSGHYGADYPAAIGTPVFSPWPGRVTATYDIPGSNPYNDTPYASYGRVVKIDHDNGMSTLFAHLDSRIGSTGPIAAGEVIGTVGTNGKSTGPHLHFEARRNGATINPASLGIFDSGGWLQHGQAALNLSGRPEPVFTGGQWDKIETLAAGGAGNGDVVAELRSLRGDVSNLARDFERQRRQR